MYVCIVAFCALGTVLTLSVPFLCCSDLWVHEQPEFRLELSFFEAFGQDHSKSWFPLLIIASRGMLFTSFLVSVLFISREVRQMRLRGISEYFENGWNRLELTGYAAVAVTNIWFVFHLPYRNVMMALSVMILVCTTMAHLRGFSEYSPIITTFIQIVNDMGPFFTIVILLWVGGSLAFKALMPNRVEFRSAMALWSVWQMVLGDTMSNAVKYKEEEQWYLHGDGPTWALATSIVGKIMSGAFVLVVVVVLMNQLIALMGDSYDRVQENYEVQARISRARVIVDMMELYVDHEDGVVFARWIHVLRPKGLHQRNGADGWQGRLKAVKHAVNKTEKHIEEKLTEEIRLRLKGLEDRLGHKVDELLRKLGDGAGGGGI